MRLILSPGFFLNPFAALLNHVLFSELKLDCVNNDTYLSILEISRVSRALYQRNFEKCVLSRLPGNLLGHKAFCSPGFVTIQFFRSDSGRVPK